MIGPQSLWEGQLKLKKKNTGKKKKKARLAASSTKGSLELAPRQGGLALLPSSSIPSPP